MLALLVDLQAASLLDVDRSTTVSRYSTPFLQQAFGRRLVRELGEDTAARARIVRHYVAFAEREGQRFLGGEQFDALRLILAELGNVRDLLHWLPLEGFHDEALRIVTALGPIWGVAGLCGEGYESSMRVIELSPDRGVAHARATCASAFAAGTYAGLASGLGLYEKAVAAAQESGDLTCEAHALFLCGVARIWLRLPGGHDDLARAWKMATAADDERLIADLMKMQGLAAGLAGDVVTASAGCRASAARSVELGDRLSAANTYLNLAMLLQRRGDLAGAEQALDDCTALVRGECLVSIDVHVAYTRALIAIDRGIDVRNELERVRNLFRTMGDVGCQNGANRELAAFLHRTGDAVGALTCLRDSLRAVSSRDDQELAMALTAVAEVYIDLGRVDDALALVQVAHPLTAGSGIGLNDEQLGRIAAVAERARTLGATDRPALDTVDAVTLALV